MNDQPVELHLARGSDRLYIFFGGIAAGITIPPFEFYNSARILEYSKVFVRDFAQSWYHAGLRGIGRDLYSTRDYLQGLIARLKPKRCFFVGNSMGGYAAILFHALLGTGEAIAFAPQTFISPLRRLRHGDYRWLRQTGNTYAMSVTRPRIWDLKPLMTQRRGGCNVSIFVSGDEALDRVHAHHLEGVPGVRIFELAAGGHEVVRLLRDSGQLPVIMAAEYATGRVPLRMVPMPSGWIHPGRPQSAAQGQEAAA